MKTIKRKGITYQIDKEDDDNYIFYITQVGDITDEHLLDRWTEYHNRDSIEDTEYYINGFKSSIYFYITNPYFCKFLC